jgi:glycosyltransferase involved in cell wall biosynthesis
MFNKKFSAFVFAGKSGAGWRDLERISKIYPEAITANRNKDGMLKSILKLNKTKNIVYIHSSPWNIIYRMIFICRNHYLLVHNPPNFISRNQLMGVVDKIILKINLIMVGKLLFISNHVLKKYEHRYKCELLTTEKFVKESTINIELLKNEERPTIFFFGRYLPYKNIELFYELSKRFKEHKFYIYSHKCPYENTDNLIVNSKWLTEQEVDEIYQKHQILITPYLETSQSGPFYLGIETNRIVIAPDIEGFNDYSHVHNIILYSPNDIKNLKRALITAIEKLT